MFSRKYFYFCAIFNCIGQTIVRIFNPDTILAKEFSENANIVDRGYYFFFSNHYSPQKNNFTSFIETSALSLFEASLLTIGVIIFTFFLWFIMKPKSQAIDESGFKVINITEKQKFFPLSPEKQTLEFLEKLETNKKYRLSANLNRVVLSPHKNTFLLEDKNFKNALLINRRRLHRKILFHNDILDVGEMVLIYINNMFSDTKSLNEEYTSFQQISKGNKPLGPVSSGIPILEITGSQKEIPLLRNLNTLGTSNFNDIVIESGEIALRHAKIYKVGQSWKIQNLQNYENTFVNGRRIDHRILKEGDEVAIGDFFFKFSMRKLQNKKAKITKKESKINSV